MTETERVAALTAHPPGSRTRANEPPSHRPGRPDWMEGWRACQRQMAEDVPAVVSSWSVAAGEEIEAAIRAARPKPPTRLPVDPIGGEGP